MSYRGAYISRMSAEQSSHAPFYSIVKNNPRYIEAGPDASMSVRISEEQTPHFLTYARTFVARMGLALMKYNQENSRHELATVPLVPFDRAWTDEALAEEIGLTAEELQAIRQALPDYHNLNNSRNQPGEQNNEYATMATDHRED